MVPDRLLCSSALHQHTDDNVPGTNVIGHYESYRKIPVKYSYIFLVVSESLKAERFQTKDGRKLIFCLVEHLGNDPHKQRHTLYKTNN